MIKELALKDFTGNWSVQRSIDDRRANAEGKFEGEAIFSEEGAGLVYEENGTLTLGDIASMHASQKFHWQPDGKDVAVYFSDGRYFHGISLEDRADDRHFCDPDRYEVTYDFSAWPVWTTRWKVIGPKKDYTMRSTFVRNN